MKTKLLTLMLVFSMVITGAISFSSVAKAAGNITDKPYEFYNTGSTGHSDWREKNDYSYVYIYPKEGPTINYTVKGARDSQGTDSNEYRKGRKAEIAAGIQASVTNWLKEDGFGYAQLEFERTYYAAAFTRGLWSPDSVGVFKIY